MGTESDKLRELVDEVYPVTVENLTNAIASIDLEIAELNEQKDAVVWGMGEAEADQITRLEAKGYDAEYYGPDFGVSDLSDFQLHDIVPDLVNISYVSANSFDVDGDETSVLTNGLNILCGCGVDGNKARVISTSVYNGIPDTTTITLSAGDAITSNLDTIYDLQYEYLGVGWDSDADIIANIDYFVEAYEHLTEPLGTTGTYGLNDKIAKFGIAKSIQQADKAKYEDLIVLYDRFAT